MIEQLHAVIRGRVQGVSFRYYTQQRAKELGLTGWVRNMPDGTVEITAEGEREVLEDLLDYLQKGPTGAQVMNVLFNWYAASGKFDGFEVTY